jgi:hypothetical protein
LARSSSGVRICTFVPVNQVTWASDDALRPAPLSCQFFYYCTSNASK